MTRKKKKVVAEVDSLQPQSPLVLTPEGSEAKKSINVQTQVTKDDMAGLIYVNVKTQLTNEHNAISNKISQLEERKKQLRENIKEEIIKIMSKQGYTNLSMYENHINFDYNKNCIEVNHFLTGNEKPISNTQIDTNIKVNVVSKISNLSFTNEEITEIIKEHKQLILQKENIERNLITANKEYVKANIIASLISSSDKGEDFIKNISNIGISIIESLKKNSVPLIGITQ